MIICDMAKNAICGTKKTYGAIYTTTKAVHSDDERDC
jgi:hypothetical protein